MCISLSPEILPSSPKVCTISLLDVPKEPCIELYPIPITVYYNFLCNCMYLTTGPCICGGLCVASSRPPFNERCVALAAGNTVSRRPAAVTLFREYLSCRKQSCPRSCPFSWQPMSRSTQGSKGLVISAKLRTTLGGYSSSLKLAETIVGPAL